MTELIRTTCPTCGDIQLAVEDIQLRYTAQSPTGVSYVFTHCQLEWERVATPRLVQVLEAIGCAIEEDFASWVERASMEIWEAETVEDLW